MPNPTTPQPVPAAGTLPPGDAPFADRPAAERPAAVLQGAAAAEPAHDVGARTRALGRRIRRELREQEREVGIALDESRAEQQPSAGRTSAVTSSWEAIADEIAAAEPARRGLATGALRGPARPNPNSPRPATRGAQPPAAPRALLCPIVTPFEALEGAVGGEEQVSYLSGRHLRVSRDAADYDAAFCQLKERFQRVLDSEYFPVLSGANAADVVFMDIETTGLSSQAPLFLIGALSMLGEPRLDLLLARGYEEEKATLAAYHQLAQGKWLITFNGKRFDWPYIEGRTLAHRLPYTQPRGHFDLLHHARRVWKHALPNCKLQTLELYLCGRTRFDDVPGREIPSTYHRFAAAYAQSGCGAHLMAPILHHNALDILTMAELVCMAGEGWSL